MEPCMYIGYSVCSCHVLSCLSIKVSPLVETLWEQQRSEDQFSWFGLVWFSDIENENVKEKEKKKFRTPHIEFEKNYPDQMGLAFKRNARRRENRALLLFSLSSISCHCSCLQKHTLRSLLGGGFESSNDSLDRMSIYPSCIFGFGRKIKEQTSSKTSFNLYCVKAEHSTYLTAPSSFAIRSPSSLRTGCIFCLDSFSRTAGSSRKSVWVPTIKHGTPGQWWWTSGNHFSRTFSNEAGEVTEKQTRKTSVCG